MVLHSRPLLPNNNIYTLPSLNVQLELQYTLIANESFSVRVVASESVESCSIELLYSYTCTYIHNEYDRSRVYHLPSLTDSSLLSLGIHVMM